MAKLSVNVNKIATLRNARGNNLPDVVKVSKDILGFGAHGITVHPRPDERHIKKQDVFELAQLVQIWNENHCSDNQGANKDNKTERVEFNVEGYPSQDFIHMVLEVRPDQCTLVPDPPEAITSNAGWDVKTNENHLIEVVGKLREYGVRSSLFIDPYDFSEEQSRALLEVKPDRIELYTERYANSFAGQEQQDTLRRYGDVAVELYDLGIGINAGHDLNLQNLSTLLKVVPVIDEVSIGHALVCEALYEGFEAVIKKYLKLV